MMARRLFFQAAQTTRRIHSDECGMQAVGVVALIAVACMVLFGLLNVSKQGNDWMEDSFGQLTEIDSIELEDVPHDLNDDGPDLLDTIDKDPDGPIKSKPDTSGINNDKPKSGEGDTKETNKPTEPEPKVETKGETQGKNQTSTDGANGDATKGSPAGSKKGSQGETKSGSTAGSGAGSPGGPQNGSSSGSTKGSKGGAKSGSTVGSGPGSTGGRKKGPSGGSTKGSSGAKSGSTKGSPKGKTKSSSQATPPKRFDAPSKTGKVTAPSSKLDKIQDRFDSLEVNTPTPMTGDTKAQIADRLTKALELSKSPLSEQELKAEVQKRIEFIEKRFPPEWHDVASQMVAKIENIEDMQDKVMGLSAGENGKAMVSYPHGKGADGKPQFKIQEMDIITARKGYVGPGEKDFKGSGKTPVDRIMVAKGGKITPQGKSSSRGGGSKTVLNSAIYFKNSDGGIQGSRGTHWHGTYPGRGRGYNQKSTLGCVVAAKPYEMDVVAMETFKHGGVFYNVRENKELPKNVRKGRG